MSESLEVWTRPERGRRRPRYTRDEIAAAAIRVADAEGFDELSMRRLASELGAGTMTLYHYVRTKDELLALVHDAVMAELLVPADELPADWREALTAIAHRSRDALRRHPWVLDIHDDPAPGPNGIRHWDQSMQAVSSLDLTIGERFELVSAIDEYVFGFCQHERLNSPDGDEPPGPELDAMRDYIDALVTTGDYPAIAAIADDPGLERGMDRDAAPDGRPRPVRAQPRPSSGRLRGGAAPPPGPAGPPGLAGHRAGRQPRSTAERAVKWTDPASRRERSMSGTTEKAILAGGCFWGMQDLFRKRPGVLSTRVGYAGGDVPNATYRNHGTHAEAIEIVFDPEQTSYRELLEFFFQIHDPTTVNRQGNDVGTSYRSAILYADDEQRHVAEDTIAAVDSSGLWPGKVVTEVVPAGAFWEAEPEHQDYLERYPNGYTCHFVRPAWALPTGVETARGVGRERTLAAQPNG